MTKRSFPEVEKFQCGTCLLIAAINGDLKRMTEMFEQGPVSQYITWPHNQVFGPYNYLTPVVEEMGVLDHFCTYKVHLFLELT